MFDVGFSEMVVVAIVALLVLGPERLPKAARFAGLWVRKARAQWYSVKAEFERELASEELKRRLQAPLGELQTAVEESGRELQRDLHAATASIEHDVAPPAGAEAEGDRPAAASDLPPSSP